MSTWQEVLWALPNSLGFWWDATWGLMALVASLIMFIKLILHHPFDAVLVSRSILAFGLFLIACSAIQSGWQRYVPMFFALGGFLSSVLLATDWCNRKNKSTTLVRAAIMWVFRPKNPHVKDRARRPAVF